MSPPILVVVLDGHYLCWTKWFGLYYVPNRKKVSGPCWKRGIARSEEIELS